MNKQDLLLEIGTEEIPAASLFIGIDQLREKAELVLSRHRLGFSDIRVYGAPRRLVLLVDSLDGRQENAIREVKGPAKRAAYTEDGTPTQAALGFARSQGLDVGKLIAKNIDGGEYVFAIAEEQGKNTPEILTALLPELIFALAFPKTMRWGNSDIRFVRPIRWIVALFGDEIIPFEIDGVKSGRDSQGHRLLANHGVTIDDPANYLELLKDSMVIADQSVRAELIRKGIEDAVKGISGVAMVHEQTFNEVVMLTEYPHAILGSFPKEFATLPREIPVTAMEAHQRYFPIENQNGELMPNFIVINNGSTDATELIRQGHERVIKARLSDARFFFDSDRAKPLDTFVDKLKEVTFQAKLGTVYQKTERLINISESISRDFGLDAKELELVTRAARFCKADLMTEMVYEFPNLQGVMGYEYAKAAGEPQVVATAIFEHYLPRHTADILPGTTAGQIVSIADKIDSICGIIAAGLIPTGSEDPYALRRQAHGIVAIILENNLNISLKSLILLALGLFEQQGVRFDLTQTGELIEDFIRSRVRAYFLNLNLAADAVESVIALPLDDIVDMRRRVEAITEKLDSEAIVDILFAVNRCKNLSQPILGHHIDPEMLQEDAEKLLYQNIIGVEKELEASANNYEASVDILAKLRQPTDKFFDEVLVMSPDEAIRSNRIRLLNSCMNLFRSVADFTQINTPAN